MSIRLASHGLNSTDVAAGVLTKAGTIATSSSSACSEVVDCDIPGTNGCTYTTDTGAFKASCNTDFYGNDMAITSSDNLSECMKNCANTPGCKAVSWSTGTCYLKNAVSNGMFSQWVDGMLLVSLFDLYESLIVHRCSSRVVCYCHVKHVTLPRLQSN
jgi:hypothetical protein